MHMFSHTNEKLNTNMPKTIQWYKWTCSYLLKINKKSFTLLTLVSHPKKVQDYFKLLFHFEVLNKISSKNYLMNLG